MELVLDFVGRHGAPVNFVVVFLDQLGLPIPPVPLLLAFGTLASRVRIDLVSGLMLAMCASLPSVVTYPRVWPYTARSTSSLIPSGW